MTHKTVLFFILSAGLILPPLVSAQSQGRFPGMKQRPMSGAIRQERADQQKDTRDMIDDLRIVRMTKELNLTDQQLAKFLPKMRENQAARREFNQNRTAVVKDLNNLLNGKASERDLQAKLSELDRMETDFQARERENRKALISQLSVEQQARLVVFQDNFEHEMRELIRGIRQGSPQPGMGPPPGPGSKAP